MLIYLRIIETVTARSNFTLVGHGYVDAYCQTRQFGNQNSGTYIMSLLVIRDLVSVLLMIGTSLYMVNLLYRHRRRALHLHRSHVSSQTSPEHKATRTILLLPAYWCWLGGYSGAVELQSGSPGGLERWSLVAVWNLPCRCGGPAPRQGKLTHHPREGGLHTVGMPIAEAPA
ncbi:Hypothetical predicted protein [Marmota monax]|uniref:Vomeronasal type-1 receptor n=1 Tax=Marmota monax TaxID=9995 RepID=A0A5E4CZH1_MARMO|nr:Hypothetical predicted protein [Marmota monax]